MCTESFVSLWATLYPRLRSGALVQLLEIGLYGNVGGKMFGNVNNCRLVSFFDVQYFWCFLPTFKFSVVTLRLFTGQNMAIVNLMLLRQGHMRKNKPRLLANLPSAGSLGQVSTPIGMNLTTYLLCITVCIVLVLVQIYHYSAGN
jgi:hypothetical protein